MNQGRIWCVVNPTVGLPLFLGGVATISLIVHASVMTHSTWVGNFFQGGGAKTKVSQSADAPTVAMTPQGTPGFAITIAPTPAAAGTGETSFVVTVKPTVEPLQHAAADPSLALAPAVK
jgi:light-harvesting protein B-800-850 alpha chain